MVNRRFTPAHTFEEFMLPRQAARIVGVAPHDVGPMLPFALIEPPVPDARLQHPLLELL